MTEPKEPKTAVKAEAKEEATTEYLEFVGMPPHGTDFYKVQGGTHTLTAAQVKEAFDVELGQKEVVWRKEREGGKMLVPTSDLTPEAVEALAKDPMFRKVNQ